MGAVHVVLLEPVNQGGEGGVVVSGDEVQPGAVLQPGLDL